MIYNIKNADIYKNGKFKKGTYITDDLICNCDAASSSQLFNSQNEYFVFPAFCDVHVHLREPGFSYKETILSGTLAAAHGGYTDICAMPNLDPVPDCTENIEAEWQKIKNDAVISVHPYASVSVGEKGEKVSDMESLAPRCIAFSDDGHGIQDSGIMYEAMVRAKALGKIIAAHCEDNSLLHGGYINDGEYAKSHFHKGISAESEWRPIERDIMLAQKTGCKYHVCHISTAQSAELIRQAKADGIDISCETAPHYLTLDDTMLQDDGKFKMNPPLRTPKDREALIEAIQDGTIDMIATDHAPHSFKEKSLGLKGSLMGITGLETAFSILYTRLVLNGIISLEKLIELMSINPRKRFSIPQTDDICLFETNTLYNINSQTFLSKGKSTPFDGAAVYGKNLLTIHGGKAVWTD